MPPSGPGGDLPASLAGMAKTSSMRSGTTRRARVARAIQPGDEDEAPEERHGDEVEREGHDVDEGHGVAACDSSRPTLHFGEVTTHMSALLFSVALALTLVGCSSKPAAGDQAAAMQAGLEAFYTPHDP
jgi:hypothetical protein